MEVVESKGSETPSETKPTPKGTMCTPIISDDMLKAATPGNVFFFINLFIHLQSLVGGFCGGVIPLVTQMAFFFFVAV